MRKDYNAPILEEQQVEIEDVIAVSFGSKLGDYEIKWPFETKYNRDKR